MQLLKSYTPPQTKPQVCLFLIRPSNYDDEGYVVRYLRGILPSNTLGCLYTLSQKALKDGLLGDVDLQISLIDEMVMRIPIRRLRRHHGKGRKVIVCFAGVQSNQFPRAADLSKTLRRHGITVLIGGFHVSGILASGLPVPPDIQELLDIGVTVVKGEVEDVWAQLLAAAIHGDLQPLYSYLDRRPELAGAPIPLIPKAHLKYFVSTNFGAIDCGRGCPFHCSFCSVITVQGRQMRYRSPECITQTMRQNYRQNGTAFYFLTDDNFSRNRHWEAIFDGMIRLKEEEGIPLRFMMQADVQSYRIPGFVEKARRAGCTQAFIGIESVNPRNLQAVGKNQNSLEDYRRLIDSYRKAEIAVHAGYILGLPFDTPDSLHRDVRSLMEDIQVDHVSFFILTPLPGSQDFENLRQTGAFLEKDYNQYEYFHETMTYPGFPEKGSLVRSCLEAWHEFYSFAHMRKILERTPASLYWDALRNFLWYKSAVEVDERHPMMAGYFRCKSRLEIRPGKKPLSRTAYFRKRTGEILHTLRGYMRLVFEMQLLWLCTRHRLSLQSTGPNEGAGEISGEGKSPKDNQYIAARKSVPLSLPSCPAETVLEFWTSVRHNLRKGRWQNIPWLQLCRRMYCDGRVGVHFAFVCLRQMGGFLRTFLPGTRF